MSRCIPFFTTALCCFSITLQANAPTQEAKQQKSKKQEQTLTASTTTKTPQKKKKKPAYDPATVTMHGAVGATLPPHLPHAGGFATAEFLYWKAEQEGLDYGLFTPSSVFAQILAGSETTFLPLEPKHPNFNWRPGFRVGLGYKFGGSDPWELYLNWTHLHSKAKSTFTSSSSNTIYPQWTPFLGYAGVQQASTSWSLSFNTLDLELGRSFFISRKIALHPHMDLRAAWIDQDYNVRFQGVNDLRQGGLPPLPIVSPTHLLAHNDFKGIGLRFGIEGIWHFVENFNLFGKIAGSLIEGHYHITQNMVGVEFFNPSPSEFQITIPYHSSVWHLRSNVEMAMGFGWEMFFQKQKTHLALNLGYEMSNWFKQNQLVDILFSDNDNGNVTFNQIIRNGDLTMHGVTLQARFDF